MTAFINTYVENSCALRGARRVNAIITTYNYQVQDCLIPDDLVSVHILTKLSMIN